MAGTMTGMPEVQFRLQWPDGSEQLCVSPSRAIHEHLSPGDRYPVAEMVARCAAGLDAASERVREVYGFACSGAASQQAAIARRAAQSPPGEVVVTAVG